MKIAAIVDYGMGNLDSVVRTVEECGAEPLVTCRAHDLERVTHIILPGVGAFNAGMQNIIERGLVSILTEQVISNKIPFLGICLGMQILAAKGWEGGQTDGLGWIDGEVKRLVSDDPQERIPHVGWNEIIFKKRSTLFEGIPSNRDFYFLHSYHMICYREQDIIAQTPYCGDFVSAIERDNIFGVQFHPEKSQRLGFQVIRNFLLI